MDNEKLARVIAFYLPQYHPIPENDEWWGKGFTEWTNVTKARPLFPGHYQPHLPADLGFYDLRLPEAREAQAKLAQEHGIHGFCYYHYWFNGRRILERPFNEVLASGKPNFPFCLCWANENWSRAWNGGERDVLLEQKYSHEDDMAHIKALIPAFKDERYIRIDGRPVFLVYRTELLPDPARTAKTWREAARQAGIGDLYLVRVENFTSSIDPRSIGFDAAVEFAPDWRNITDILYQGNFYRFLAKCGLLPKVYLQKKVARYEGMVRRMLAKPERDCTQFRCVTPGFDNSPRRSINATILVENNPERYQTWLKEIVTRTNKCRSGDERIVFINAWNEWAEGNHLEPDLKYGHAFLEATRNALIVASTADWQQMPQIKAASADNSVSPVKRFYWRVWKTLRNARELVRQVTFSRY